MLTWAGGYTNSIKIDASSGYRERAASPQRAETKFEFLTCHVGQSSNIWFAAESECVNFCKGKNLRKAFAFHKLLWSLDIRSWANARSLVKWVGEYERRLHKVYTKAHERAERAAKKSSQEKWFIDRLNDKVFNYAGIKQANLVCTSLTLGGCPAGLVEDIYFISALSNLVGVKVHRN